MTLEQANYREQPIPDWVERERWVDLAWIADNLPAFHSAASIAYEVLGRGAVVVETTYHTQDGDHPGVYLTQEQIARYEDAAIDRLIVGYTSEELAPGAPAPTSSTLGFRRMRCPEKLLFKQPLSPVTSANYSGFEFPQ